MADEDLLLFENVLLQWRVLRHRMEQFRAHKIGLGLCAVQGACEANRVARKRLFQVERDDEARESYAVGRALRELLLATPSLPPVADSLPQQAATALQDASIVYRRNTSAAGALPDEFERAVVHPDDAVLRQISDMVVELSDLHAQGLSLARTLEKAEETARRSHREELFRRILAQDDGR
jgi:hypothetical protein